MLIRGLHGIFLVVTLPKISSATTIVIQSIIHGCTSTATAVLYLRLVIAIEELELIVDCFAKIRSLAIILVRFNSI